MTRPASIALLDKIIDVSPVAQPMNRLHDELQRLYALECGSDPAPAGADPGTRVMVFELALPLGWEALGAVWQGVQGDLALPAPAIAVSGMDSYQLWFSLDQALPRSEALAFLQALRRHYLNGVPIEPVRVHASVAASAAATSGGSLHSCVAPPNERAPGRWSAFLTPDLAALFAEEPWLDLPPGADAQADLLARLQPTPLADLRRALGRLTPAVAAPATPPGAGLPAAGGGEPGLSTLPSAHPGRFLLGVMNDPSVELSLRIEAAKALLPYYGSAPDL